MKNLALGIDIGGTSIKSAFIDEKGDMRHKFVVPVFPGEEALVTLERLSKNVKESIARLKDDEKLIAVGCGCPGAINAFKGTCDYSNNLGWKNIEVAKILKKAAGMPVAFDNDANAAMLGEVYYGSAKKYHNAILLTLGTGVGGGLYLDDHLYIGNEGKGAELGHMVIELDGEQCTCGRKGCLEAYASANALKRMTREAMEANKDSLMWKYCDSPEKAGGALPFKCASEGDVVAKKVVDDYVRYLSEGILNFIAIFRPEAIILSGGVSKQGENLRKPIVNYLEERGYGFGNGLCPKVEILISTLGADMGIYGAAALGLDSMKKSK